MNMSEFKPVFKRLDSPRKLDTPIDETHMQVCADALGLFDPAAQALQDRFAFDQSADFYRGMLAGVHIYRGMIVEQATMEVHEMLSSILLSFLARTVLEKSKPAV